MSRLPPQPELDWSEEAAPRARAFDDVYFSRRGGLAESEAVFLAGCGLPEGWRNKDRFALCELGFGTGLNVLAAWRAWKNTRLPHAQLHISSVEAYPLAKDDAARALAQFPEVSELAAQLLARWPVRAYAPQRLWFPADGLSLTLHIGEAAKILPTLSGAFDAWFLDGFAPARNPAMWSADLFHQIARLSAPGARLATFTVAGDVRRGLAAAGFEVEKKPGFGAKRERLEATLPAGEARTNRPATAGAATYPYAAVQPKRVAIIGAGIAGASIAHALGLRGIETIVLEAARTLGAGASGNPAGLVMPRLDRGGVLQSFHLAAYLHAVAAYEDLGVFERCGVEQLPDADGEALADLIADPPLPHDWFSGLAHGAALHARAGLVRPVAAAAAMLARAHVLFESPAHAIERADGGWILRAPDGRALMKADAVVLACGAALRQFGPAQFLPLQLSRGQVEWGEGPAPAHAKVRGSYVAPFEGRVLFGATFDKAEDAAASAPDETSRRRNLAALRELAPEIAAGVDVSSLRSRAALRVTTPDRAPIAGLLPDSERWLAQYAPLAHGGRIEMDAAPPAHDGVYVIGGLGARGLTSAPLLGEIIAAEMCGEPALLPQSARDAIHPARFLHRALKRS
ncbi:MAG TPA: bifunctional tRNA (5-methylaminomethyl-2-thiouridine)(34)-methyltransferase MnmD/FAD-dependent 5-carboxymethylaminomethyl-2-thiouridine(34) oxidoreductase MnmC [Vitreimonas sp.]|uniref:bifunctional tRNA (5-methylaminomethyl-2-thiouridine)(34)-methyltransferase MnmD/FAD-dependent 5-carboxymethylaminomethyl-2-thiouridine(34) oxidoreductase MnmC n=1 Tax=Vitreimonas sp. TaxID=3069702 RepID=UPI002D486AF3|nr:bifunctional tRNA (5-methylaminomethyl-2-thiouridine)(34)-methyltransferase MnmD/FAD-dependent 5-carboxymethylaminomethyl-2-thiouridine(34) oxidoreductase MnmC [Vitreimonas sp.]HYD86689.1 bifunctional tRNA (5-methylaminomethyl-2-thiouridine)(34)-methyltransferase MnmD/FAD-dependent 5-carboxymethylaminomethyl-2-thiouridine(34) oxidoreductase MnmC [Vitreimonas sp.]